MIADESPKCRTCKHRAVLNMTTGYTHLCCYYIVHAGKRRGCPVENCDKYEEGNSQKYWR